jgi:serine/threonine protein kinase
MLGPGETATRRCGSITTVAPEMIQWKPYGNKVDVFACGAVLYAMVVGYTPFVCDDWTDAAREIVAGVIHFPRGLSRDLKLLIRGMMKVQLHSLPP